MDNFNPPTGPGAGEEEEQEDGHTRSECQCMLSYVPYNNLYFVQSNDTRLTALVSHHREENYKVPWLHHC